jgi:MFS family permease
MHDDVAQGAGFRLWFPVAVGAKGLWTMWMSERGRGLVAVISTMAVVTMTFGVTPPLLALVLERQGVSNSLIGMNTAVQALAALLAAPFIPRLMIRFGLGRMMLAALVVTLLALLLLPVYPNVWLWFPLRLLLGIGSGILWICSETWINQLAEEHRRGRIVALYGIAGSLGLVLGALVLSAIGSEGWAPFLALAGMVLVAGAPILAVLQAAPPLEDAGPRNPFRFLRLAPTILLLNLVYGAAYEQLWAFVPLYGLGLGMGEATPLRLLATMGIGAICLQYPLGWLADHMSRRFLLVVILLALIAGMAVMPLAMSAPGWNFSLFFLLGGVNATLYNLGMVLLGERFRGADLAGVTAMFGAMWSVGGFLGPPVAGAAMDAVGPHGLPLAIACMFALYLPLPLVGYWRGRQRR